MSEDQRTLPTDLTFYTVMSFVGCCCCGGWLSLILCLLVKHNMSLALERRDADEFYKWKGRYWWAFFAGVIISLIVEALSGALTGAVAMISNM